MADFIDQDGDGYDDRIAAELDRQNPGWREAVARVRSGTFSPIGGGDIMMAAAVANLQNDPGRLDSSVEAVEGGYTLIPSGPQAWGENRAHTIEEMRAALPSRESMAYTPTGYDPTLVDESAQGNARASAAAIAAQRDALGRMSANLQRPDLAARAGLDRAQLAAAGGGPGSRQALAQAALQAAQVAGDTQLRGLGALGAAGTARRSMNADEELTRAGARDQLSVDNARRTNESRAYLAGEQTGASIRNATIPSRQLGLAMQFSDLQRGEYDRADARNRQAQEEAAQRTRDLVGGGVTAGVGAAQAVSNAIDDEDEAKTGRPTYGWSK